VATGVVVVLAAAFVYTLGEMTAGPVTAALSAEAPPPDQRGRYMAATQLAWSASGAVAPLLYSFLLQRGSLPLWGGTLVLCLAWSLCVQVLAARMPLVAESVTNVAESAQPVTDPETPAPLPE
jgi:MFS family permease